MDELVQNQEFFTFTGTLLGAMASLVTIAIAVGETLKPGRLDRRISRLNRMLEHEGHPERVKALKLQKIELESALFAREKIPSNQYVLWVFAMLIPFANQLSLIRTDPPSWMRAIVAILAIFIFYRMASTLLDGLLQRRIVQTRYIMGQNPFNTPPDEGEYNFTTQWLGKLYSALIALGASLLLIFFISSWWNGQNLPESIMRTLGLAVAYTSGAFFLKQDIEEYMTNIAIKYAKKFSQSSQ